MKKLKQYLKKHHLALITVVISIISLLGITNLNFPHYFHKKELAKQNKENYLFALNYYDELAQTIKNRSINNPFSDIDASEIYDKLYKGCQFKTTTSTNDDKENENTSCVLILGNINSRLLSFNSETQRIEILQELNKLKNMVNTLMKTNL